MDEISNFPETVCVMAVHWGPEAVEDRIIRSELTLVSAIRSRDVETCQSMLGESFFAVVARSGSRLETMTRSVWLRHVRRGSLDGFAANDIHVRAHRGLAVATIVTDDELVTDIWFLRTGSWSIGERHVAQLTR